MDILFEDRDLIAINKPAGILVHRGKASSRTEAALLQMVRDLCGQHVHAVHRLDRPTSGVILFAKSAEEAARLSRQFQSQETEKTYFAIVRGWPAKQTVHYPLLRLDNGRSQDALTELDVKGRLTLDIPCDRYPQSRYAWLELKPATGRRHQLRRHMKHIHHPIVGDSCYGHGVHNRLFREALDCPRLLLHHFELRFKGREGEIRTLQAPLDEDFQRVVALFS